MRNENTEDLTALGQAIARVVSEHTGSRLDERGIAAVLALPQVAELRADSEFLAELDVVHGTRHWKARAEAAEAKVERVRMAFPRCTPHSTEGDESTWAEHCHRCRARVAIDAALASEPTTHESEEA